MAERKKHRPGQIDADVFRALPERAQEIWFQYCEKCVVRNNIDALTFPVLCGFDYSFCKSPIEVIFNLAYDLIIHYGDSEAYFLEPQYEVVSRNEENKYYVDFAFIAEDFEEFITTIKNPNFKLAIECDGHEFHEKTKEQVQQDNEREYELKMSGFDVLHFSGSQIYNNPFKCAAQTLNYIKEKVEKNPNGRC